MMLRAQHFALAALFITAGATTSFAQWQVNGVRVCATAGVQQNPSVVSDGAGGAIITWWERRTADPDQSDIYAQHLLASGVADPAWPVDGRALCNAPGVQWFPNIVSDDAGGAIVTWEDGRSGDLGDIYAQHVLASGVVDPSWTAKGTLLCNAANRQLLPRIVADGAGGAIVVWLDLRNNDPGDIYSQHVLASGVVDPAWPANGLAVCNASGNQDSPDIVSDGAGGAVVAWTDQRAGSPGIYAQRVLALGTVDPAWPANGRALRLSGLTPTHPAIVSDGAAGAVVTWQEGNYFVGNGIYAHRVLSSGSVDPAWPANGQALSTGSSSEPTIVTDGAGGAIVAWRDFRSGLDTGIYGQHVLVSGTVDPSWPVGGTVVCPAQNDQVNLGLVSDGAGGAIATWLHNFNFDEFDLYMRHLLASGVVDSAWPADGLMCNSDYQTDPRIAADGTGGTVVTWVDYRGGRQIYAQRGFVIGGVAAVTPGPERFTVRTPHPNPTRGGVTISFELPAAQRVSLRVYDVSGQLVRTVIAEREFPAGSQNLTWDGFGDQGTLTSPGVYFVQVTAAGVSVIRRIAVLQ